MIRLDANAGTLAVLVDEALWSARVPAAMPASLVEALTSPLTRGAPLWVLWATAFCVNLRFLIFSAQRLRLASAISRSQRV